MSQWQSISAFRLVTQQMKTLVTFYKSIGFTPNRTHSISTGEMQLLGLKGGGLRTVMTLGNMALELDEFEQRGYPYPSSVSGTDPRFQHLALVTSDIDTAWSHMLASGAVPISINGPIKLPESSGGVTAVKFRDPEGHPLELLQFSDARASQTLIERIDHSAISVSSAAQSLEFYEGSGFKTKGRTLNTGLAQSALDAVYDAHVDVIPLASPVGQIHIELLHYRGVSRSPVPSSATNDVCATRVVWRSEQDAVIRDPDGHHHQFTSNNSA